jgi:hypothetical protein
MCTRDFFVCEEQEAKWLGSSYMDRQAVRFAVSKKRAPKQSTGGEVKLRRRVRILQPRRVRILDSRELSIQIQRSRAIFSSMPLRVDASASHRHAWLAKDPSYVDRTWWVVYCIIYLVANENEIMKKRSAYFVRLSPVPYPLTRTNKRKKGRERNAQ